MNSTITSESRPVKYKKVRITFRLKFPVPICGDVPRVLNELKDSIDLLEELRR